MKSEANGHLRALVGICGYPWHSGTLVGQMVKNPPAMSRPRFDHWVWKIPWRREWLPIPVFLPGKSMDRGACPWDHKESDKIE